MPRIIILIEIITIVGIQSSNSIVLLTWSSIVAALRGLLTRLRDQDLGPGH